MQVSREVQILFFPFLLQQTNCQSRADAGTGPGVPRLSETVPLECVTESGGGDSDMDAEIFAHGFDCAKTGYDRDVGRGPRC